MLCLTKVGGPSPQSAFKPISEEMVMLLTEKGKMGKEVGLEWEGKDLFKTEKNGFQVRARKTSQRFWLR